MSTVNDVIIDSFGRIQEVVHRTVKGLSTNQLAKRPGPDANSIAWLVWHLTRVQDDHISEVAEHEQIWTADSWCDKFGLPFTKDATGYGQSSEEVAVVQASAELLCDYYDAVHEQTLTYIKSLTDKDYARVVDESWKPPVTLAARLVSVISDDMQHAGQAAYLRGLLAKS